MLVFLVISVEILVSVLMVRKFEVAGADHFRILQKDLRLPDAVGHCR